MSRCLRRKYYVLSSIILIGIHFFTYIYYPYIYTGLLYICIELNYIINNLQV